MDINDLKRDLGNAIWKADEEQLILVAGVLGWDLTELVNLQAE